MSDFTGFAKSIANTICKNSPKILMAFGIAGSLTAGVLAVKATVKACKTIEDEEIDTSKPKEVIKATWKYYISPVAVESLSIACLICSNAQNERQKAALAAACAVSERALEEYEQKVIETIGPKKNSEIKNEVSKRHLDQTQPRDIIYTGRGTTLCMDSYSGQVFESSADAIRKAVNDINRKMRSEIWMSLNEFYMELGIEPMMFGDEVGWNIDTGYIDIYFTSIVTKEERPCLVINYNLLPAYNFAN